MEDSELISSTLAGDRAAYLTLARRHAALAVSAAYTYARDMKAAEDVAVAALALAYRRLGAEGAWCNFPALVLKSVRAAYRACKREKRRPVGPRVVSWARAIERGQPQTARHERLVNSMRRVRETLKRLPTSQRMALNLRLLATLSYSRIAAAMGIKSEEVSALLAKAAATVRKQLIDLDPREWD